VRVFDASIPAVHRIDRMNLARTVQRLVGADVPLDPYGIALPGDGTVWTLADKGRFVFRFSEATGERVEKRRLPEPCQGVTTFWNRAAFFAVRLRAGERVLLRSDGGALWPFSPLVSRSAPGLEQHLIANLVKCGSGNRNGIPCWFLAGDPDVLIVDRTGSLTTVSVPTYALPSATRDAGRDPGASFTYPVRDAFLLDGGALWVLANQEGDRTPLEDGARRGRHAALVRAGRAERTVTLSTEARAILDASELGLLLLFADGSIARVSVR
jgi:hypothetical protein